MTLATQKIARAYDALTQGVVCLDDNLRQGVLVYVESLLVERNIPRSKYLTLEDLHCHYPYVRMGSYMPIDFFGRDSGQHLASGCNDVNFRPISIKLCTASQQDGHKPVHRWHVIGTYRDDQVIETIHALLEILSNTDYFNHCKICRNVRPAGYLDDHQVCDSCCDGLLGVA